MRISFSYYIFCHNFMNVSARLDSRATPYARAVDPSNRAVPYEDVELRAILARRRHTRPWLKRIVRGNTEAALPGSAAHDPIDVEPTARAHREYIELVVVLLSGREDRSKRRRAGTGECERPIPS